MRPLTLIPLILLLAAGPALGQIDSREGIALQNQILELRRELQALQARMGSGATAGGSALGAPTPLAPPRGAPAIGDDQRELLTRLLDRVAALETEVRLLRGRSDETQNALRELAATVEKNQADVDFRLQELEGSRRPAAAPTPAQPQAQPRQSAQPQPPAQAALPRPPAAPAQAPAPRSQAQILNAAREALRRQDWATAEREAQAFIAAYPRDARVGEAYQIRADALFGRREYMQAALAYDDARSRTADRARRQEILLGLGRSLGAINETASACEVFRQLASDFADDMRPDVREALTRERARLRC
jgi:TolA-binding protein